MRAIGLDDSVVGKQDKEEMMKPPSVVMAVLLMVGCRAAERAMDAKTEPIAEPVLDGAAPELVSWSGSTNCCGEDPHAVHGAVLSDGSVLLVGKAMSEDGQVNGFASRWAPSDGPAPCPSYVVNMLPFSTLCRQC